MPVVTIDWVADAREGDPANYRAQLTRSEVTMSPLTVNLAYSGTATSGTDYTPPSTVTFNPGSGVAYIGFADTDDSVSEPTETIVIALQSGSGYTVGTASSATVNIFDNDAQYVSVEKIDDATEGGSNGLFRFTRIGDLSSVLSFTYSVSGSSTASGTDYTLPNGPLAFTAGSATSDVYVQASADNLVEGDESLILNVTSGTGYSIGSPSSATVTIHDDPPVIGFLRNS